MPEVRRVKGRLGALIDGRYHCDKHNGVLGPRWEPDGDGLVHLVDYVVPADHKLTLRAFGLVAVACVPSFIEAGLLTTRLVATAAGVVHDIPMPMMLLGARALDMAPHDLYGDMNTVLYGAWKPMIIDRLKASERVSLSLCAPPAFHEMIKAAEVDPPSEDWLFDLTLFAEGQRTWPEAWTEEGIFTTEER